MTRHYKVAGLTFGVELSSPFTFMDYAPEVAARIASAAAGKPLEILPTRAGDDVPPRTFIHGKDDLPEDWTSAQLDFSQYEPFFTEDSADEIFHLTVLEPSSVAPDFSDADLLLRVEDMPPFYSIYHQGADTLFIFEGFDGKYAGNLRVCEDASLCSYRPATSGRYASFFLTTSLMILYTYFCARYDALLIHSSVVSLEGRANMFLGKSGTGKSTHSRLWLDNIPETTLLNDDNPVIRLEDGRLYVYGSPWSGKTPCYRNIRQEVRAIVSLNQAPCNKIRNIKGLDAYTKLISSVSSVRWERAVMDKITASLSTIAMTVPCYDMDCLPDPDAAFVCREGIMK